MTRFYHMLPFEKIKKGSRLVLYGAGEVGQWYLQQLQVTGYAKAVALVDKAWAMYPDMALPVVPPDDLSKLDFDYILVSIENEETAAAVARDLSRNYDVSSERIVLGCNSLMTYPYFLKPESKLDSTRMELLSQDVKVCVSIVVPVYNAGEYLRETLESIAQQQLKNFEVICIDDGSMDDSYNILEEFARKDKRFIIMRNSGNIGAARTRNIGLQLAKGEYVTFWDADDYYRPDCLQLMYKHIVSLDADVCFCNISQYNVKTNKTFERNVPEELLKRLQKCFSYHDLLPNVFCTFDCPPFNKLLRRSFLMEEEISFQDIPGCNDIYFSCKVVVTARKMAYLPVPLIRKNDNWGGNISSRRGREPMVSYLAMRKLHHFLRSRGILTECRIGFNEGCGWWLVNTWEESGRDCDYRDFLLRQGLEELGIQDLQRQDFVTDRAYSIYKLLLEGRP